MTYLQLINRVLRALRENQIAGVSGEKALFYGQLINEVKTDIEDKGPWYALRTRVTGTLTAGTSTASLTGSTNERSYLMFEGAERPLAFITTTDKEQRLCEITWDEMDRMHTLDPDADSAQPYYVAFNRSAAGLTARFFPTPDLAYTYRFTFLVPQDDLSAAGDTLTIPSEPVWREAVVRAMEERGEEFSGGLEAQRMRASEALYSAIMQDFGREQWTFEAV